MTVEIRPAQPNAQDAAACIELANIASHGIMGDALGKQYCQILTPMYLREDNLFSHDLAYFVTVDGRVAGTLLAFTHAQKVARGKNTDRLFFRYSGWGLPRFLWMGWRLKELFSFMDDVSAQAYYVQALAVYPEFRGRGLGKLLLAKADEIARAVRATRVELDVESDNAVAIRAYEGHGMRTVRSSARFYVPTQRRYVTLCRMEKVVG